MQVSLLAAAALASLGAQADKVGSWNVRTISDPMTDASRGIASTDDANDLIVVLKCDTNGDNTLYMSVLSKNYLGGTSRNKFRDIAFRIDGAPAEKISAYYDGRTANVLSFKAGSSNASFLQRLSSATKLTLQVSDYDYKTYASVIDVTGAKQAIKSIATTCKDQAAITLIGG